MPTTNKLFGIADPQYDALRVLSTQALQVGPGDGSALPGGGLENKIYLWPADGSTISVYDPTQAGLVAALAAAVSGDTVILPSITIAMTVAVTVPAGVALRGLSDNATLNFSGFSGTAITLSIGSVLFLFSISMVSNGTTAIGVDNSASDSAMVHVNVQASGGTSTNIAIGQAGVTAREIWALYLVTGDGFRIMWSNTYGFDDAVNDTTWNLIDTWPAGFDSATAGVFNIFTMKPDGTEFYIGYPAKIWRCTNVPAIRAAPATVPTYEVIADSSILLGGYALDEIDHVEWWSDRLIAFVQNSNNEWYYGEYSGGAWVWTSQGYGGTGTFIITGEYNIRPIGAASDYSRLYNTKTLATILDAYAGFGGGGNRPNWRSFDQGSSQVVFIHTAVTTNTKIMNQAGTVLHDTGLFEQPGYSVGGSLYGSSIGVSIDSGETFFSSDGNTYVAGPTLGNGVLLDPAYTGSGAIWIWSGGNDLNNGDIMSRISLNGGSSFSDKTGNFWAVMGAENNLALHGVSLVF